MILKLSKYFAATTAVVAAVSVALAFVLAAPKLYGLGAVGFVYVAFELWRQRSRKRVLKPAPATAVARKAAASLPAAAAAADDSDPASLVEQMLAQGRFALLLRSQIISNLSLEQQRSAREALDEKTAFVPVGEVVLGPVDDALADGKLEDHEILSRRATVVHVEPYFLDRHPVTNHEYYEFVAAGGYDQLAIWDKEIWPAMVEFIDETGQPGPRYWVSGRYPEGEEKHPVVGICWYEAMAYARWVGKRLPTDAEWVKAGAWPVALTRSARFQRKFPWGNTMQANRANLWSGGAGKTVPVDATPGGVSVGGVHQLIGNVWEWTASRFVGQDDDDSRFVLQTPMRSIRGGAFDTYFENQATCQFQSGENPVLRRHNIGFRCAIGLCDLAPEVSHYLMGGEDAPNDDASLDEEHDLGADSSAAEHAEEVTA